MIRLTFFILFTCACLPLQAQVNLVQNPGFEDINRCPYNFDQIKFANYWSGIDTNYVQNPELLGVDSFGSPFCAPDLCHTCPDLNIGYNIAIPYASKYWQYPHSGNAFAQVVFFYDESAPPLPWKALYRDYLFGHLSRTLTAGKRYQVRFYANLCEDAGYAIANIEAYLDDGTIVAHGDSCNRPQSWVNPQITNSNGIISDTMSWVKVEGTFSANGTERFITIGNFKNKANTQYQWRQNTFSPGDHNPLAIYLIDDVSVIPCELAADGGGNRAISPGDSTYIGRPPEPGLDCTWYLGSDSIGSGAGIWVKPDTTTTYRVLQQLCGESSSAEVTVFVWPAGLYDFTREGYSLYPSPNSGSMSIRRGTADGTAAAIISDMRGATVYKGQLSFKNGVAQLDSGITVPGLYLMRLEDNKGKTFVSRFVVE